MLLCLSLILPAFIVLQAKDSTSVIVKNPVIYAITIRGNEVTSEKLILREMLLKPGMIATPNLLERDQLKISSLGLFNRVEIELIEDAGRAVVLVTVTEQLHTYLFPKLNYNLSKPEDYIYGGGAHHNNFRGVGQQLTAMAWTGTERGYYFAHLDPWFGWGKNLSISWRGWFEETVIEDTLGVEHKRQALNLGFENRYRLSNVSWVGWGVNWEEQSSHASGYTYTVPKSDSSSATDRLLVETLTVQRDSRDYRYYPTKGALLRIVAEANQMVDENHYFLRQSVDFRIYRSVRDVILAGRFWGVASQKDLPSYRRIGLSRNLIRSRSNFKAGGGIAAAINLETRFNLISKRYYSFELFPLVRPYVQNMQFSMEGFFFFDAGFKRFTDPEEVKITSSLWAYGFGLQFQLPYVETVHVSTGWAPDLGITQPLLRSGVGVTF